jgi:hypothetical protein
MRLLVVELGILKLECLGRAFEMWRTWNVEIVFGHGVSTLRCRKKHDS